LLLEIHHRVVRELETLDPAIARTVANATFIAVRRAERRSNISRSSAVGAARDASIRVGST
jgi:hypothetical protein